jgi:hypothetical protein
MMRAPPETCRSNVLTAHALSKVIERILLSPTASRASFLSFSNRHRGYASN